LQKTSLIVDCDTGIDDALALLYVAADPHAELVAAGSVHGNVPAPLAAQNTLRVLELTELGAVPVTIGAGRPIAQPRHTSEDVHGRDGLGNTNLPRPLGRLSTESAAEQITRLARERPGALELLATGPLTNLALALLLEPDLPALIPRVVLMGGAVEHRGNVSAVAEANVWHDPEAAELVFAASWDVTMVGLDVTTRVLLDATMIERFARAESKRARFAARIIRHYLGFYEKYHGIRACAMHDPLAAAVVTDPSLCRYEELPVRVELHGAETRGATIVDRRHSTCVRGHDRRPKVKIALEVDAERFLWRFAERVEL
jgi:purine nucleosidase